MEYKFAREAEGREQARKMDALSADVEALMAEYDAERADNPEAKELLTKLAAPLREEANKRLAAVRVTQLEKLAARQQFIEQKLKEIEQEHVMLDESRKLKIARSEQTSAESRRIDAIEAVHAFLTVKYDRIVAEQNAPALPRPIRRKKQRDDAKATGKA